MPCNDYRAEGTQTMEHKVKKWPPVMTIELNYVTFKAKCDTR